MALLLALLQQLGALIGRHPLRVFFGNLLLFLPLLSYFLLYDIRMGTDVRRGFSHRDGRASKELQAFGDFYNVSLDGLEILLVFLESKHSHSHQQQQQEMPINGALLADIARLDTHIRQSAVELRDEAPEEEGNDDEKQQQQKEIATAKKPKMIRLEQLMTVRGDVNFLFHAYKWAHLQQEEHLLNGRHMDSQIHLRYPVSHIYGFDVPISSHFFGVVQQRQSNDNAESIDDAAGGGNNNNATSPILDKFPSEMVSARCIGLWYMFDGHGPARRDALARLESRLFQELTGSSPEDNTNNNNTSFRSAHFVVHLYADQIANREMIRGSTQTIRLLSIGIGAMVLLMAATFWDYRWHSQLLLITLALLSPSLAIAVTFALLGWLGIEFNAIMSIMPFLVLGIGVDNAFLLLHSWRKWSAAAAAQQQQQQQEEEEQKDREENDENKWEKQPEKVGVQHLAIGAIAVAVDPSNTSTSSAMSSARSSLFDGTLIGQQNQQQKQLQHQQQRMAQVVVEMGPSIAITSITNALAFGIGIFSCSTLMSSFCLCTTMAIILDFFFEFCVFAPCLPLIRWNDQKDRHNRRTNAPDMEMAKNAGAGKMDKQNAGSNSKRNGGNGICAIFCHAYAHIIVSRWSKCVTAALLTVAYTLAAFGIGQMEATFEPQKTFPGDSPLQASIGVINRVMAEYSPITFIVFQPPDIGQHAQLEHFAQMVNTLQGLPNTGHVQLWLTDYLKYNRHQFTRKLPEMVAAHPNDTDLLRHYRPSYALVPRYLRERRLDDKRIVVYRQQEEGRNVSVDKFVFTLSRQGELTWHERAHFVDKLRTIVDRFPEFNVTVFDYDSTIYDLILTVKTETLKAVLVTLTCMALVCFFVIPNIRNTTVATFSVLSISFTLMGALGWWGQDMDPVTMINVLMAIGFSVDFSAHICYHFDKMMMAAAANQPGMDDDDDAAATPQQQIEAILNAVGRPMLEAATTTVICVCPLFFLHIYIIQAFARTVLCVGVIGTIHGLFIVPVLLSLQLTNQSNNNQANGNGQQKRQIPWPHNGWKQMAFRKHPNLKDKEIQKDDGASEAWDCRRQRHKRKSENGNVDAGDEHSTSAASTSFGASSSQQPLLPTLLLQTAPSMMVSSTTTGSDGQTDGEEEEEKVQQQCDEMDKCLLDLDDDDETAVALAAVGLPSVREEDEEWEDEEVVANNAGMVMKNAEDVYRQSGADDECSPH